VLVYERLASVRAFDAIINHATIEQLHALRIEFKKLRYTVEFFREVMGDEAKEVINEFKKMQDHLGDLNDAQVATVFLSQFLHDDEERQVSLPLNERHNLEPVVAYQAYRYAERHRLLTTFQPAWENFNRPEMRQKIALAVSVL
jgi:CHAD domain-containing protein